MSLLLRLLPPGDPRERHTAVASSRAFEVITRLQNEKFCGYVHLDWADADATLLFAGDGSVLALFETDATALRGPDAFRHVMARLDQRRADIQIVGLPSVLGPVLARLSDLRPWQEGLSTSFIDTERMIRSLHDLGRNGMAIVTGQGWCAYVPFGAGEDASSAVYSDGHRLVASDAASLLRTIAAPGAEVHVWMAPIATRQETTEEVTARTDEAYDDPYYAPGLSEAIIEPPDASEGLGGPMPDLPDEFDPAEHAEWQLLNRGEDADTAVPAPPAVEDEPDAGSEVPHAPEAAAINGTAPAPAAAMSSGASSDDGFPAVHIPALEAALAEALGNVGGAAVPAVPASSTPAPEPQSERRLPEAEPVPPADIAAPLAESVPSPATEDGAWKQFRPGDVYLMTPPIVKSGDADEDADALRTRFGTWAVDLASALDGGHSLAELGEALRLSPGAVESVLLFLRERKRVQRYFARRRPTGT